MVEKGLSAELIFGHYWDELYKMVVHGCFDCVAHLDFPKIFYELLYDEELMQIFDIMVKRIFALKLTPPACARAAARQCPTGICSPYTKLSAANM